VDRDLGQGQGAHEQLVLLDQYMQQNREQSGFPDLLVARARAQHVRDPLGNLAVAGAQDGVERPRRGEQPVHLHPGDDVLECR